MKQIYSILVLSIAISLTSCDSKPFKGYVVGKEYISGHMCHSEPKKTVEAIVVVPHPVVVPPPHHHEWIKATFTLYVANRYEVRQYFVDSLKFQRTKMLDKVTFY